MLYLGCFILVGSVSVFDWDKLSFEYIWVHMNFGDNCDDIESQFTNILVLKKGHECSTTSNIGQGFLVDNSVL